MALRRHLRQARLGLSLGPRLRLLLALLAAALAWHALFDAAEQSRQLERGRAARGRLGGRPAYAVAPARSTQGDDQRVAAELPGEVVELLLERSPALLLMLGRQARVGNPARDHAWPLDLLVSPLLRSRAGPADFPSCAVLGRRLPLLGERAPLPVDELWRCRPVPLPDELADLGAQLGHGSLLLNPLDARALLGPAWTAQVRSAVVGLDDVAPLRRLDERLRQRRRNGLEIRPLSVRDPGSEEIAGQLASGTRAWRSLVLLALPMALGLHARGVWPALRREAALRACLGHGAWQLGLWFASNWLAQTLLLGFGAWALACGGDVARGSNLAPLERLGAFLPLLVALVSMAALGAWLLVLRLRGPGRMMAWMR